MQSVQLFVPCLVDQLYPEIGKALVALLRALDVEVRYDPRVTCCGQPAFNAGDLPQARIVARTAVECFEASGAEPILCPSGSCSAMMRVYYPELFEGEPDLPAARRTSGRVLELSEFLMKYRLVDRLKGRFDRRVGFHNSCHTARELGLRREWRDLFAGIDGLDWVEPSDSAVCCGFGGLFCQKFQGISQGMAKSRLEMFVDAGAEAIVSNDPGCIMHMRLQSEQLGLKVPICHTIQLLGAAMGVCDVPELVSHG